MIPNHNNRVVQTNGVAASGEFGISLKDSAHLMSILRDTLYSDKIKAILREYAANAWDAHRDAGRPDLPIEITLPTAMEPTLSIQDFGKGLSQEDVFEIYTQYGASTKRGSDNAVGMLGIGCKSGFSYSDSFTIISRHGGMKKTYIAVLDATNKGVINLMHEEPCGEETGVTIEIAAKPVDILTFQNRAEELFRYFNPQPVINHTIPRPPAISQNLKAGVIFDLKHDDNEELERGEWLAVMGCVPYKIDLEQLQNSENEEENAPSCVENISGALYFKIGEIQVNASREGLKYNEDTKKALVARLNELTEEYSLTVLKELDDVSGSFWDRRNRAQTLRHLGLSIPTQYQEYMKEKVEVAHCIPKTISLRRRQWTGKNISATTSFYVSGNTRIIIRDDQRAAGGYAFSNYDYHIIRNRTAMPIAEVMADVQVMMEQAGLEGVPVVKTSELPWTPVERSKHSSSNDPRHKHTEGFQFQPGDCRHYSKPYSQFWNPVSRTPTPDDVFIILDHFKPEYNGVGRSQGFFARYLEDAHLAKMFHRQMPPVYGYKTTEKRPVTAADCVGTPYFEWSTNFTKSLVTDDIRKMILPVVWGDVTNIDTPSYYGSHEGRESLLRREFYGKFKKVCDALGQQHPLVSFIARCINSKFQVQDRKRPYGLLDTLRNRIPEVAVAYSKEIDRVRDLYDSILRPYPLLKSEDSDALFKRDAKHWFHYIHLIDNQPKPQEANEPHPVQPHE
jgi:hypothetical protein